MAERVPAGPSAPGRSVAVGAAVAVSANGAVGRADGGLPPAPRPAPDLATELDAAPLTGAAVTEVLVFERGPLAWALPRSAVASLGVAEAGWTAWIRLAGATGRGETAVRAERVHGWAAVTVREHSALLARGWPQRFAGLAVWRGRPVVVLDPGRLPAGWVDEQVPPRAAGSG
jgi:hypothetical protein